ncbi:MAG: hypothetical protein QM214_05895 [Bacillota bacterium]|jgi:uncharacterized protein YxeA|nr:hypothetical protein [Bacillota bacterium]HHU42935.1 hypothetical protein [Clostridiales bacterium]
MKKTFTILFLIALIGALVFTFAACDKDPEEPSIDRFEIEDLTLTEGDTFKKENVKITAYKSDGETASVQNNLEFDLSELEDVLDDDNKLSDDSAGEYTVPVYHLEEYIGDLKVIVKVRR